MNKGMNRKADDSIQRQAAEWVARVYSGNASQADEDALEHWLAGDPKHRAEYFHMLEVWDSVGAEAVTAAAETKRSRASIITQASWFRPSMAAAALLMVSLLGINFMGGSNIGAGIGARPAPVVAYSTAVGETEELVLGDGSTVTLNTDTKLFVDFSGNIRRAILDSGEAFFDVASDPGRPFVVTAGSQSVTVLGTRFNVQRKGVKLTVAVVEGKVAVHENLEPEKLEENAISLLTMPESEQAAEIQHYLLEAGSVGTFEKSADLVGAVEVADAESHQSWRQGVLRFSNQSLGSVVDELSRYTELNFVITDSDAAAMNISGVFHHDDLDGVLAGLEAMLPISVSRHDDQILIASATE